MYSKSTIISAGSDLVGWSSSTNTIYSQLPSNFKNKTYNVNDLPGITLDVVESLVVEKSASDYVIGLNTSEIVKLVDQFAMSVKNQLNTKELLKSGAVVNKRCAFDGKLSKESRFYGYAITPQNKNGVKVKIESIGFYSDSTITGLTVYVYKASEKDAVTTISYNHTSVDSLEWQTVSSLNLDLENGEQYLIGYFQDDLTGDVYTDSFTLEKDVQKYVSIFPCSMTPDGVNRPKFVNPNAYHPGFNLKINASVDISDILVSNIDMFSRPLQYAVAVRILSDALSTTHLNNISMAERFRETWKELRTSYNGELNGGVLGNGVTVKGMIDRLALDFSGLDPVCLPDKEEYIMRGKL